ncbi:hypothetical protein CYMTET_29684 [Cymbomonas tetramitiformis]|uniref:Uncharacterized protein n=1 Tax=Cymbomonas tetramitiformis TaxID=36881 RepID=A0AAE0KUN4_9CHLO|nr:hypothetical protein CYMTET_29684 [Cymbomonas tetramitiformis]
MDADGRSPTEVLADEGLRHLHDLLQAATDILVTVERSNSSSLTQNLNPVIPQPELSGNECQLASSESLNASGFQRSKFQATKEALQRVLEECTALEEGDEQAKSEEMEDAEEGLRLQSRLDALREEAQRKNKVIKLLINEMRALLHDLSLWQK